MSQPRSSRCRAGISRPSAGPNGSAPRNWCGRPFWNPTSGAPRGFPMGVWWKGLMDTISMKNSEKWTWYEQFIKNIDILIHSHVYLHGTYLFLIKRCILSVQPNPQAPHSPDAVLRAPLKTVHDIITTPVMSLFKIKNPTLMGMGQTWRLTEL